MQLKDRVLNKNTIKPVLKFLSTWDSNIYSLNTPGAKIYHFTLDYYNNKPSFTGGFSHDLIDCYDFNNKPYDRYAIDMTTGAVYDLTTKNVVMTVNTK